jgi:diadenosine tetraphosphate (Ap4A) HIT family hydrolase
MSGNFMLNNLDSLLLILNRKIIMSSGLCLASVLTTFSSFFCASHEGAKPLEDVLIIQGQSINLIVPARPLAPGAVKVVSRYSVASPEWQKSNELEAYELIHKVVEVWKQRGISDYLIYRKESPDSKSIFSWEIVPYPKEGWRFWKQFKVLWNITFGGTCLPKVQREHVAKDFLKEMQSLTASQLKQIDSTQALAKDVFCDPKIIGKQLVYEGREIYVLYNYAPIGLGKEKLHFLIVPKQHRLGFTDLTQSEYLEVNELSNRLIEFYDKRGLHVSYSFIKTGIEAGQTVLHMHLHIVFAATEAQEIFGKLIVLKNMIVGSSALSQDELKRRVETLRKDLSQLFSE